MCACAFLWNDIETEVKLAVHISIGDKYNAKEQPCSVCGLKSHKSNCNALNSHTTLKLKSKWSTMTDPSMPMPHVSQLLPNLFITDYIVENPLNDRQNKLNDNLHKFVCYNLGTCVNFSFFFPSKLTSEFKIRIHWRENKSMNFVDALQPIDHN